MTNEEFENLRTGDVIRHILGTDPFFVTGNYGGGRVIAVNVADVTNPVEWVLLRDNPSSLVQDSDIQISLDLLSDIRDGLIEAIHDKNGLDGRDGTYLLGKINRILGKVEGDHRFG